VVNNNMDALEWLRKHLDAEGSDLLREMVRTFAERLMAAAVEVLCNAGYGEVTPERVNSRNGYRPRTLDTGWARWRCRSPSCARAPTSRAGCWPRRRAERALVAVVAECYVRGVSIPCGIWTTGMGDLADTASSMNRLGAQISWSGAKLSNQRSGNSPSSQCQTPTL
jgi:hypothetical protein